MTHSASTITVLTHNVERFENKYLTCLWSSVRTHGIKVEAFNLREFTPQVRAGQKIGDVIHLNWIQEFCKFDPDKKNDCFRYNMRRMRDLIYLKSQGYQVVWTIHNTLTHECKMPLVEWTCRFVLSHLCDDMIVMSKYSQREVARIYGRINRVHIIPHGNYLGAYPDYVSRADARQKLGIAPNQTVFLHIGMIRPYKGIDSLLAAFKQLKDANAVLLIAGDCPDAELATRIKRAAQADARILPHIGFVADEDIQIYLNACDWAVLPYRKILNSGSALLALSFKRPTIVPLRGALKELIHDGENGFSYRSDRQLVSALQRAMKTSPEHWQSMCDQAYRIAQDYDWSAIGAKLSQLYQQRQGINNSGRNY